MRSLKRAAVLYQPRGIWVIDISGDCPVPDLLNCLVDHEQRHEEPFARDDRLAEAILDLDVKTGGAEDPMDQVFKPRTVDVKQLVGGDGLDLGHEEGRIELGIGKAAGNVAAGHADLVQDVTVSRDGRVVGLAAQHIDDTAGLVPFLIVIRRWCGEPNKL